MSKTAPSRLNTMVNVAILITIAILLFGPTGPLGRRISDWRTNAQQRALVESSWDEIVTQAAILSRDLNASDTIAVFTDYECPFCRDAEPALQQVVASGLALAVLHLPLEQIHPRAREAASAAVCAEERGMFAGVHRTLMETERWRDGDRWSEFADENGIADSEAFVECMASDATSSRVMANGALAAQLGVHGTPTFVTDEGIETGLEGLQSVLSQVGTATLQAPYELGKVLLESATLPHEEVSELGSLSDGLILDTDRVLLADGQAARLFFVDMRTREVTVMGRKGEGPGDYRGIRAIGRIARADGVFVDDPVGARVTMLTDEGKLIKTITYNPLEFRGHVMIPRPLSVDADGTIVFRDADPMFSERPAGAFREKISYLALAADGSRTLIAEAPGRELVREDYEGTTFSNHEKPFSYSSLEAVAGDLVLVADTETGDVAAYNRAGDVTMEFSFGPGVPVTSEIDAQWREERVARLRERDRRGARRDAPSGLQALLDGLGGAMSGEQDFYRTAEGNAVTPALSRMLVDGDGMVWAQRFTLPGADTSVWQRWRPGADGLAAILDLPVGYRLLDALGDRVLLRVTDAFGVPSAIVATIREVR